MEDNLTEFEERVRVPFLKDGDNIFRLIIIIVLFIGCVMETAVRDDGDKTLSCVLGINLGIQVGLLFKKNNK